jgi:hypothetical protein
MTSQKDFLQKLVKILDKENILYMLSGSIGSGFHGQPRATNDADIIIDPSNEQLISFVSSLGPDYYVSKDAAIQALNENSMFNIIDIQTGWKADLIIRKKRPYSEQEFSRRTNTTLMGMSLWVLSPEDSILSKLEWSKGRESQTQFKDALGVIMVQWDNLDFDYMRKWAKELKIEDSLEQLLKEAQNLRR